MSESYWDALDRVLADSFGEDVSNCPACGEPIDYCQGHGELGDPAGAAVLAHHDNGEHLTCHADSECVAVIDGVRR